MMVTIMVTAAHMAQAQRITSESQVIDCGQVVFRKPVTMHFELTNEGPASMIIKNVETSCGCTQVTYPKGAITVNKPFVISATYDAKQMGHFEKYIDVFTSGASLPYTLTMRGVVVDEIRDFGGDYQFTLGKIKADINEIMFDDVNKGEDPVAEIHVLNTTSDVVTPVFLRMPDYLKATISPSSIPPGKSASIHLTLNSRKLPDYGLTQTSVYLGQSPNDRVSADKEIAVTAILLPSFGMVTEEQLLYMPKLKVSDTVLDLGDFEGKKRKKGTIVLENLGRTDLEISKVQVFTEGIMVDLPDATLQPGESVKMRITAERKSLKGVRRQLRVLLITNDPRSPKVIIDVNVK